MFTLKIGRHECSFNNCILNAAPIPGNRQGSVYRREAINLNVSLSLQLVGGKKNKNDFIFSQYYKGNK